MIRKLYPKQKAPERLSHCQIGLQWDWRWEYKLSNIAFTSTPKHFTELTSLTLLSINKKLGSPLSFFSILLTALWLLTVVTALRRSNRREWTWVLNLLSSEYRFNSNLRVYHLRMITDPVYTVDMYIYSNP